MAVTARLIGRLGGGRESQQFTVSTTTTTRSVGEGQWLCVIDSGSDTAYINGTAKRVAAVTGPTTVTFRVNRLTHTGYIAPLT